MSFFRRGKQEQEEVTATSGDPQDQHVLTYAETGQKPYADLLGLIGHLAPAIGILLGADVLDADNWWKVLAVAWMLLTAASAAIRGWLAHVDRRARIRRNERITIDSHGIAIEGFGKYDKMQWADVASVEAVNLTRFGLGPPLLRLTDRLGDTIDVSETLPRYEFLEQYVSASVSVPAE